VRRFLLPGLIFLVFFVGTALCQRHIYQTYKKPEFLLDRIFLLPKPETMKFLAAGYESTIADFLWIRGIQYYGQHFSTLCRPPEKGEGLIGLFRALIALDPDFKPGYKWGAFVLTESMNDPKLCPGGARRAIDEFLAPATERFPDDYTFPSEAGFTAYWHVKDSELAVKFFTLAAAIPGAPPNLERMIWNVKSEEDSQESLEFAYDQYLRHYLAPIDGSEKHIADNHLKRILVRFHQFHLEQAVEMYKQRFGKPPAELEDLVRAKIVMPVREAMQAYVEKTGRRPPGLGALLDEGIIPSLMTDQWPVPIEYLAGLAADRFAGGLPVGPGDERYVYLPKSDQVVVRQTAEQLQRELVALVNFYLAAFRQKYGRCPESLEELVPEYLTEVPSDPLDMELSIDPLDCTIVVELP
jgi:hypothetical protein